MKFFLLVVCCVALAAARPSKGGDKDGKRKPPLEARMVKLCLTLAEEALDAGDKRSWDDVFGMLAPVCEAILEELDDEQDGSRQEDAGPASPAQRRYNLGKRRRNGKDTGSAGGSGMTGGTGSAGGSGMTGGTGSIGGSGMSGDKSGKSGKGPRPSGPPPGSQNILRNWFNERSMDGGSAGGDDNGSGNTDGQKSGSGRQGSQKGEKSGMGSGPTPTGVPDKKKLKRGDEAKEFDKVKALLGICKELVEMAEAKVEAGETGRSVEEADEAMKAICDAAFDQAEIDALE